MSYRAAFALSFLAAPLAAQGQSGGPLVGLPAAVIPGPLTTAGTGSSTSTVSGPNRLATKTPGFSRLSRLAWGGSEPDFDRLFQLPGITLEVDAITIGEDDIASDCSGVAKVPANAWNSVQFTVSSTTKGEAGSLIESEFATPSGASADVFSYLLPGSTLPPSVGVGRTHRAMDGDELGLQGKGGAPGEVGALDSFIMLYKDPVLSTLLQPSPQVYFSLTSASAAMVPSWFPSSGPSGATILTSTWNRVTGAWTPPRVFLHHQVLGLTQTDDVDAFAYDTTKNIVLFSTVGAPVQEQLKILCLGVDNMTAVDYVEPSGREVTVAAGVGTGGEITAVCTIDPVTERQGGGPGGSSYDEFAWGTAKPPLPLPFPTDLEGTNYRTHDGSGADAFHSLMVGWPGGTPKAGSAFLMLLAGPVSITLGPYPRNPANPIAGDPVEIPPIMSLPALFGVDITAVWIAVDSTFTNASLTHPTVIRI